jgi:hypothetical protein
MIRHGGIGMNMRKWWPYIAIGGAVVIVSIAYPAYFRWWDHRSCQDSGGHWNEASGECIEPRGADIPDTKGSSSFEDDNQAGEKKQQRDEPHQGPTTSVSVPLAIGRPATVASTSKR